MEAPRLSRKGNVMEFPAMLYRYGSMFDWDGEQFDYLIVGSQEEADAALADGWSVGKPEKVAAVVEAVSEPVAEPVKRKPGRPAKVA